MPAPPSSPPASASRCSAGLRDPLAGTSAGASISRGSIAAPQGRLLRSISIWRRRGKERGARWSAPGSSAPRTTPARAGSPWRSRGCASGGGSGARCRCPRSPGFDAAAGLLLRGGLVALPTETVYGLGALALEPLAVRAIYAAKGRAATNPLIVHVLGEDEARPLCARWPIEAQELVTRFWPGPLTLVLPRTERVPDEVTGGGSTVAVRAPSHPAARQLLARVRAPLAAPSANRSEHVSPTTASHVLRDLNGRIDAVLDGGRCPVGIESTVVALTSAGPRLLRAGAVARSALEELLGEVPDAAPAGVVPASPGQQQRHYAPAALVRLAEAS